MRREQRSKRTRERKRKKKAPRSSSYSSRGRARRRRRQWHVPYWFPVSVLPTLCSRRSSAGLTFWVFWLVCICVMLVLLVAMHLAICSLLASPGQDAPHPGRYGPEGLLQWHFTWLVLLVTLHLALCSLPCFAGPFLDPMVQTVQDPVEFTPVQFLDEVVFMPVVGQRLVRSGYMYFFSCGPVVSNHRCSVVHCGDTSARYAALRLWCVAVRVFVCVKCAVVTQVCWRATHTCSSGWGLPAVTFGRVCRAGDSIP